MRTGPSPSTSYAPRLPPEVWLDPKRFKRAVLLSHSMNDRFRNHHNQQDLPRRPWGRP